MKIAEVSGQYNISQDTLRYYERIGLILPVHRSASGIREYSELDFRRIEFIKCMRSAGMSIEALIEYMDLVQQGDGTIEARKEILQEQRDLLAARLQEMQKTLNLLNHSCIGGTPKRLLCSRLKLAILWYPRRKAVLAASSSSLNINRRASWSRTGVAIAAESPLH
jgi:DNA-binding transcriptional MerR regulator